MPTTTTTTRRVRTTAALLTGVALALAGCGDAPDPAVPDPVDDPAVPAPDSSPDPEPDPGETDPAPDPDTVEPLTVDRGLDVSTDEGGGSLLTVTDVRIGSHAGFDRVVFEIAGQGPAGWHVAYVDQPATPGQGAAVDIGGEAFLGIFIRGVAMPPDAPDHDRWDGERLTGPAGAGVVELVDTGIFEGQQDFYVGVREKAPFGVVRLDDPQRIVVEIER